MCEVLLVAWPRPEPFERSLRWALQLERLGVAGFGWGVAWREDGRIRVEKDPGRLGEDEAAQGRLAGIRSDRFLVHLRRPSRLSTISLADTQPFAVEDGRFAFCHNGSFDRHRDVRPRFAGRLRGSADSEVGFRVMEELLGEFPPRRALPEVHRRLGGDANLGYLDRDGVLVAYGGHRENDFWTFRLDGARVAATGLHSADASVFDLVFPDAVERRRVGRAAVTMAGTDRGRRSRSVED